jgi:hypothetical protein
MEPTTPPPQTTAAGIFSPDNLSLHARQHNPFMYVNENNPNGTMKRPQFNHRKRTRTDKTVYDIINAGKATHNTASNNHVQITTDDNQLRLLLNEILEEQLRPLKQQIVNLSKKVTSITNHLTATKAENKTLNDMNLKLHEKVDYLIDEHSLHQGAGPAPEQYKNAENQKPTPTYANIAAEAAEAKAANTPTLKTPTPNIPIAQRTLTIPTQKPEGTDLIAVRNTINSALKEAGAPDNAIVTHIDTNLRNNIVIHTGKTCKAESLRPYTTQINKAISTVITDAPSIRIHEKWTKIMVHSVSLDHFPETATGMALLQEEIEKYNSCKLTCPPRYLTRPETRTNKKASTIVIALPSEATARPLLKNIDIHGRRHTTERFYTARPWDQCSKCQQHGHHHMRCKNDARCKYCAEPHKTTEHQCNNTTCRQPAGKDCTHTTTRCALCSGTHRADSPRCEARITIFKAHNIPTGIRRNQTTIAPPTAETDENSMEVDDTTQNE